MSAKVVMRHTSRLSGATIKTERREQMTQIEEREHHAAHPNKRRHNKFDKDTIKCHRTDHYSFWKSVNAQTDYAIELKKKLAREEEARKRTEKKNKGEVVND